MEKKKYSLDNSVAASIFLFRAAGRAIRSNSSRICFEKTTFFVLQIQEDAINRVSTGKIYNGNIHSRCGISSSIPAAWLYSVANP